MSQTSRNGLVFLPVVLGYIELFNRTDRPTGSSVSISVPLEN